MSSLFYCKRTEKGISKDNTLTGGKFKYWRVFRNGVIYEPSPNNNTIYRFDKDGSFYTLDFNFYNFNWELVNDNSSIFYNNIWILHNDSIRLNFNTYKIEIENINTDSIYIVLSKNTFYDSMHLKKGYYILKPFNSQIDGYFNFKKIKNKKGTNCYFDKKLRNQEIKKWQ
ncbi:MAG: hypothetical protein H6553_08875 [Chitinophagales bacterium]|nr:hypothetical protein [Chitinophagales bacterium]